MWMNELESEQHSWGGAILVQSNVQTYDVLTQTHLCMNSVVTLNV